MCHPLGYTLPSWSLFSSQNTNGEAPAFGRIVSKKLTSELRYQRSDKDLSKKPGSKKTANEKALRLSCKSLAKGQYNHKVSEEWEYWL